MATLKANGEIYAEIVIRSRFSDNADADEMTQEKTVVYRAMQSGKMLKKVSILNDGEFGEYKYNSGWKVSGKIKPHLIGNKQATFEAMQSWADQLRAKGKDVEIS